MFTVEKRTLNDGRAVRERGVDLLLRSKGKNEGQYVGVTGKHFKLKQINIPPIKAVQKKTMFLKNHFLNILSVPDIVLGIIIFITQTRKLRFREVK